MSDNAPNNFIDDILEVDIVEEQVQKMFTDFVPYEHLEISCNKTEIDREKVEYLLDEKENGVPSDFGLSKWEGPLDNVPTEITIKVKDEFKPITLTHYAFKSSNDPSRVPSVW